MQQELNKVYENSFAVMEDKLREQASEIKHLKEALAARDMVIHNLQSQINDTQDKQVQKNESKQVLDDLVEDLKKNLDKGIDSILNEPSSIEVARLSKIIKREVALAFLEDSQKEQQQHPPPTPIVHTMHSHNPPPQLQLPPQPYPSPFSSFPYTSQPSLNYYPGLIQQPQSQQLHGQPVLMQMPMPSAPYDAFASAPAVEVPSADPSSNTSNEIQNE